MCIILLRFYASQLLLFCKNIQTLTTLSVHFVSCLFHTHLSVANWSERIIIGEKLQCICFYLVHEAHSTYISERERTKLYPSKLTCEMTLIG